MNQPKPTAYSITIKIDVSYSPTRIQADTLVSLIQAEIDKAIQNGLLTPHHETEVTTYETSVVPTHRSTPP
jgi:hypothetical protein